MIFFETLKMSVKTLKSNVMRTFLTVLGIVIGIGSIIGLTSITEGATQMMISEISALGSDKLFVGITSQSTKDYFTESDFETLENVVGVTAVSPSVSGYYSMSSELGLETAIETQGVNEIFFEKNNIITEGRALNYYDVEYKTNAVVIGEDLANDLFANMSPIGEKIKINGIEFNVVGVAESYNSTSMSTGSEIAYIVYPHMESTFLQGGITNIEVYFDTDMGSSVVEANVEQALYFMLNSNEDAYSIFSMQGILDIVETMTSTMALLMAGIAAISLLVGGIGIMNMMLTSVTERTNEIGLKKALGAEKSVILLQFIVEAVIISLIGGIVGIGFGYALAALCGLFMDFTAIVTANAIAFSVIFSMLIGLVFGIFPAKKAAALRPIEALRAL